MINLLAGIIVAALWTAPDAADASSRIEFHTRPHRAGETLALDRRSDMTVDMQVSVDGAPGQQLTQEVRERTKREDHILNVSAGVPTSVRTTYHVQSTSQAGAVTGDPVQGQSYIVSASDAELSILNPRGEPVPDAEAETVRIDFARLGKPDGLAEALDGRTFATGETLELSADGAAALLGLDEEEATRITSVLLTFKEKRFVRGMECGVFDLAVEVSGEIAPKLILTMEGTGEVVATTTGRTVSVDLSGDIDLNGEDRTPSGQAVTLTGAGRLAVSITSEWR